jgi:hypothetical protein
MLYRTTDAGFTWSEGVSVANASLFGLSFGDAAHGWASGERGTIIRLESRR